MTEPEDLIAEACALCALPCTADDYCYVCLAFVCEMCSLGDTLRGIHIPEDHLEEGEEDDEW